MDWSKMTISVNIARLLLRVCGEAPWEDFSARKI